jgi:hypothetical protein
LDAEAPVGVRRGGCDGVEGEERCGAVDVALDDMASERRAGGRGEFEVEDGVGAQVRERGAGDGLGGQVGGEARGEGVGLDAEGGETDAVDRDAVAGVEACGEVVPVVSISPVNIVLAYRIRGKAEGCR